MKRHCIHQHSLVKVPTQNCLYVIDLFLAFSLVRCAILTADSGGCNSALVAGFFGVANGLDIVVVLRDSGVLLLACL